MREHPSTTELLSILRKLDVELLVTGNKLRIHAAPGKLTPELREAISQRKTELISYLLRSTTPTTSPIPEIKRAPRDCPLPLSFAQQRLWFLDQFEPGSAAYNLATAVHMVGELDVAALRRALQTVIERHESLRTRFADVDGTPLQLIDPPSEFTVSEIELLHLPAEKRFAAARQFADSESARPFDLEHGPLLRIHLLRLAEAEHVLLLVMHHIIIDAWALSVLFGEIFDLYTAYAAGVVQSPLAPLTIQYADYASWQREWLEGPELGRQLEYWREQLRGMKPALDLPVDRSRSAIRSARGAKETLVIEPKLAQGLNRLSLDENATLYMTMLAAFKLLLWCYAPNRGDIVVGSSIAGRTQVELERVIGFFANTLVLRTPIKPEGSFLDHLRQLREVALQAFANQDLPFVIFVMMRRPPRTLGLTPLFQVMFVLHNTPPQSLRLNNLTLNWLPVDTSASRFDLSLFNYVMPQEIISVFEYSSDLFDALTIKRMAEHFQNLLENIVADPSRSLLDLRGEQRAKSKGVRAKS